MVLSIGPLQPAPAAMMAALMLPNEKRNPAVELTREQSGIATSRWPGQLTFRQCHAMHVVGLRNSNTLVTKQ